MSSKVGTKNEALEHIHPVYSPLIHDGSFIDDDDRMVYGIELVEAEDN